MERVLIDVAHVRPDADAQLALVRARDAKARAGILRLRRPRLGERDPRSHDQRREAQNAHARMSGWMVHGEYTTAEHRATDMRHKTYPPLRPRTNGRAAAGQ